MTNKVEAQVFADFGKAVEYYQKHKPDNVYMFRLQTTQGEHFGVGTTEHRVKLALVDHLLVETGKMSLKEMFDRMFAERETRE